VLYQYGNKLGKSDKSVDDEVWNLRSANAKPAIPLSLESFIDGKKVSLDDFKGKIVLLDFWYPSCGPCLRAMPYMQELWSRYKSSGLVFLAVNGMEGEANFVMPLVKSRGWGFVPLKGSEKWCSDVYQVTGFPSTFLIGADGKVYFRPHTYDQEQHDIAEMEIKALLAASELSKKSEQPK
jgi:thiol-disulfide isomerase/thioredoxin